MNPEDLLCRIRIVLCQTHHPGNIGAVARAMNTMGLSRLHLVQPKTFPDAEATARATSSVNVLEEATVHPTLDDALVGTTFAVALSARRRDLGPMFSSPRDIMPDLLRYAETGEVALVFGNETTGLSNTDVQRCQASVTIPTRPECWSLNLGAAVQVLCYEARMAAFAGLPPPVDQRVTPFSSARATHEEVEMFYQHLETAMTDSGFYNPERPRRLLAKIRRLFGRAGLEKDEINILRGILAAQQALTVKEE